MVNSSIPKSVSCSHHGKFRNCSPEALDAMTVRAALLILHHPRLREESLFPEDTTVATPWSVTLSQHFSPRVFRFGSSVRWHKPSSVTMKHPLRSSVSKVLKHAMCCSPSSLTASQSDRERDLRCFSLHKCPRLSSSIKSQRLTLSSFKFPNELKILSTCASLKSDDPAKLRLRRELREHSSFTSPSVRPQLRMVRDCRESSPEIPFKRLVFVISVAPFSSSAAIFGKSRAHTVRHISESAPFFLLETVRTSCPCDIRHCWQTWRSFDTSSCARRLVTDSTTPSGSRFQRLAGAGSLTRFVFNMMANARLEAGRVSERVSQVIAPERVTNKCLG